MMICPFKFSNKITPRLCLTSMSHVAAADAGGHNDAALPPADSAAAAAAVGGGEPADRSFCLLILNGSRRPRNIQVT